MFYNAGRRERVFKRYDDIPPLVVQALLLVENRELEESEIATRNPVVDWKRSAKASLLYAGHKIGLPVPVEGGSTLATQLEKFRYAEDGRTRSDADKLRQMLGASLRVYHDGSDTREQRRQIVLDYLNSVPLAAVPGYGEVHGLGNGLHAWFGIDLAEAQAILKDPQAGPRRELMFKHVLALICAARAPSVYLRSDRSALAARVGLFTKMLEDSGVITHYFAEGVRSSPLRFPTRVPESSTVPYVERKATNAIRNLLLRTLDVGNLYTLDRFNLNVGTSLDMPLQNQVLQLFSNLKEAAFIDAHGLRQRQLLARGDPRQITYSFTLFERTPFGNELRVQADTLEQPFDLNNGMKLELGQYGQIAHSRALFGVDRRALSRIPLRRSRQARRIYCYGARFHHTMGSTDHERKLWCAA